MDAPKNLSVSKSQKWLETYRYYFSCGWNTNYAQKMADEAVKVVKKSSNEKDGK